MVTNMANFVSHSVDVLLCRSIFGQLLHDERLPFGVPWSP
jgi:hypothetical protein